jgi:hypothetical protein
MCTLSRLDPSEIRVAVIIPTYSFDRLETLRKCLTRVFDNARCPDEVIVVVDANQDLFEFLTEELRHSSVMVAMNVGKGVSAARNTGASKCHSEVLLFVDDDVAPDRNWLTTMTETLCAESVAGVGGHILPDYEEGAVPLPPEILWIVGCTYKGHPKGQVPITRPIGSTMAFRKDAFVVVGGFNSQFGPSGHRRKSSNEELVISENIRQRFGPDAIQYQPESIVYHRVPKSRTTFRFLVQRSWVEGTSKAEVRHAFSHRVLNHDRQYLFGTMLPSTMRYLFSGNRTGVRAGFQLILVTGITATGFLTSGFKSLVRERMNRDTDVGSVAA